MRVLIIGGTAFMGPHVVQYLIDWGHEVTVFHRGQTKADLPPEVQEIPGDRRNLQDFAGEFKRLAPEVVLDMIPFTQEAARALVNIFKGVARRVVAISSMDVYRAYDRLRGVEPGPPDPAPLAEDALLREKFYPYREMVGDPENILYHYDKILVEQVVMSDPDLPGTALRLPMVYGPRDRQHRLFPYLKRMDDQRPVILLSEQQAQWRTSRGYAQDIAFGIALAVVDEQAVNRVYNICEAGALREAEWVKEIGKAAGWNGKIITLPPDRLPQHLQEEYNWNQHLVADSSRIRAELGYAEPIPQDEALQRTVAWERANPPEKFDPAQFDYAAEDALL